MGFRVKPVVMVVIGVVVLALLISVGFVSYKIKSTSAPTRSSSSAVGIFSDHPSSSDSEDETTRVAKSCDTPTWECNIRLEPNVYPLHYDLFLHPDFETGLFTGKVTIELNITSTVDHIRLHTKFLNVTSTVVTIQSTGTPVPIEKAFEVEHNEYWVVQLKSELQEGMVNLTLDFDGTLTRGIVGFYRSQYRDPTNNETKYVVSSKFQPTFARRAFPCFDEPSFKSTFTVTLIKPSNLVALSNMPVEFEEKDSPSPSLTRVHFKRSIPMVTYLVAFAIGDFAYREGQTKSGIPVRIYATSFKVQHTEYAATITPKIVDFFEKYFDVKYPLPKLDIIGVPDFVSGAMEHWGMISFREVNLLFQRGVGSPMFKQRIASVIAHELAHMWFGNLVTLKWWNDLWLNEGFASYMEYEGLQSVHPDWEIMSQFVSEDLTNVLHLDGQLSSHPIVQPVSHPDQITEIFDTISYSKGASVIRMLENFMGPKNFQQGVSKFLKKFAYKNAVTEDLWDALQSEAPLNVNISFVMDTWTRQMGYPILTATASQPGVLTVSQNRYYENPLGKIHQESPFGFNWEIPLLVSTSVGANSTQLVWLPHTQKSVDINITKNAQWVKVNTGQLGYYRVKYESEDLRKISIDFGSKFSPEERCGLLDDAFALAFSNYTSYGDAFEFALKLKQEKHIVPWKCADPHLRKLLALLNYANANTYALFRKFVNEITEVQYNRLTWTDEETDPHLDRLLKPRIFSLSCEQGIGHCREQARTLFLQWLEGKYVIPTSLRVIIYKWGVAQSNDTIWDMVWQKYRDETDASEKIQLLQALAFTKETWVISKLLNMARNETLVRRQDYFLLWRYISYNPNGNPVIWNYYRNEWPYLLERFGANDRQFGRIIKAITENYSEEIQLQEMMTLFETYRNAGAGTRARESAVENVQNNIQWVKRSLPAINAWLQSHYSSKV